MLLVCSCHYQPVDTMVSMQELLF